MATPPLFVLDHNFPISVTSLIRLPDLAIRPLQHLYPDLIRDHEDWEVIRELRVRGVDGWITLDSRMLNLPKEMIVLHQSRLSLVVFERVGNDPLVAAGLLMIHAPAIAKQTNAKRPQLWVLRKPPTPSPTNPWERISALAGREGIDPRVLYRRHRLSPNPFQRG